MNANATGAWQAVQLRASAWSFASRLAFGSSSSKYCAWNTGLLNELSWRDCMCCSTVRGWQIAQVELAQ